MHSNIIIAMAPMQQVYWFMLLKSIEVLIDNTFTNIISIHASNVNDWIILKYISTDQLGSNMKNLNNMWKGMESNYDTLEFGGKQHSHMADIIYLQLATGPFVDWQASWWYLLVVVLELF